jgi:hypothetical protein
VLFWTCPKLQFETFGKYFEGDTAVISRSVGGFLNNNFKLQ